MSDKPKISEPFTWPELHHAGFVTPESTALAKKYAEHCNARTQDYRDEIDRLQKELSRMVCFHGGENAGHLYGATNCGVCKKITNDYYLIGKTQVCLECEPMTTDDIAESFKAGAQWERERSKGLLELVESDIGCDQDPKITSDVVQYLHSDNCRKCRALANYRATGWTESNE